MHLSEDLFFYEYRQPFSAHIQLQVLHSRWPVSHAFPKSNQSVQKCCASCCNLLARLEIWFGLVRAAGCRVQQNRILTVFCPATCRLKASPERPTVQSFISFFSFYFDFWAQIQCLGMCPNIVHVQWLSLICYGTPITLQEVIFFFKKKPKP